MGGQLDVRGDETCAVRTRPLRGERSCPPRSYCFGCGTKPVRVPLKSSCGTSRGLPAALDGLEDSGECGELGCAIALGWVWGRVR